MDREIELKFSISNLPNFEKYKDIKIYKILQNYIYQDEFSAIRKRKIIDINSQNCSYIYTVKTKGNIKNKNSVFEIETNITEEIFDKISSPSENFIKKYRLKIPINNNLIAELDLYYENLEGLITVEVEFHNEKELNEFQKPDWFGAELDKKLFSNANLSKMTRKEFMDIISSDTLIHNMKIKDNIEKNFIIYKKTLK